MNKSILVVLCIAFFLSVSTAQVFRFAVVGDRTGGATGQVFEEILKEIELLDPDFVMSVGDLIEGYQTDSTVMHAQWDTILATIRTLPAKFYFTPGNHELENETDRRIYEQRTGFKRYYSFNHENSHFIILDNSMTYWAERQDMEPEQFSWLTKDLEKHRQMDNIFVFYHIPTYIYALENGTTDTLVQLFEKYGVDVVFTGHHHEYSYYEQNGIEYINVGSSGGSKSTNDPARGHFFQYLLVTVRGKRRNIAVFEKESALPRDVVTLEDIQTIERADKEAITADDLMVDEDARNVSQTVIIKVNNFGPDSLTQRLMWQVDPAQYTIRPNEMQLVIAPEEKNEYSFDVTIADGSNPFPIPRFTLAYPFTHDKVCTLYHLLSVKRHKYVEKVASAPEIDGRLDDPLWRDLRPIANFANYDGSASSPVEKTEVYFAHDVDNLYFAARCHESNFSQLRANIFEHDGETYYDDNVWLFFDPNLDGENYYQAIINCNGSVFDRKCATDGTRDISWNGAWQVSAGREQGAWILELKIAKAELAPYSEEKWGFNMRRLQPRLNDAGYWSIPFGHSPQYFGILLFE